MFARAAESAFKSRKQFKVTMMDNSRAIKTLRPSLSKIPDKTSPTLTAQLSE